MQRPAADSVTAATSKDLGHLVAVNMAVGMLEAKNVVNQKESQRTTGKEIVPVNQGEGKQVQVINKFVVLQIQANNNASVVQKNEGDHEANNQLVVVEDGNNRTPRPSPVLTGKTLNPAAPTFNPSSPRTGVSKEGKKGSSGVKAKD